MKIYAYYLKTESGDETLIITPDNFDDPISFMKSYLPAEYDAWKDEGYEDSDIPYCTFLKQEYNDDSSRF